MRKNIFKILLVALLCVLVSLTSSCKGNKTIRVCASELPHADVLENAVAPILKEQGYTLKVYVLDWTLQNDAVATGDYHANYFQHIPYLNTYEGEVELFAACKVHYEPLGIYQGKSTGALSEGTSFAICNDESNAVRAFELLQAKGVLDEIPVSSDGKLTFTGTKWTSKEGVSVTLIAEELLVASMPDYDFVCLPCNTAYTGNVDASKKVAFEDDKELVSAKANVLAARASDYQNDPEYKAIIDALVDALLSQEVSDYVNEKYNGAITCDETSQIDLR
mgnify:FL=1